MIEKINKPKTLKGVTSMIVTMIVIIVLGIISLGFTRLILSESTQTSNNDLSQSAYDTALAGVEDAKIAVLKYHDCLNAGYTRSSGTAECRRIIKAIQDGIASQDCDTIKNALAREDTSTAEDGTDSADSQGVIVQETQSSGSDGSEASSMLQQYTCVTVKEDLADYRTMLSASDRIRLIPLRSDDTSTDAISKIEFNWFSQKNLDDVGGVSQICGNPSGTEYGTLPSKNGDGGGTCVAPPVINLSIMQTDQTFKLQELTTAHKAGQTDRGTLVLRPLKASSSDVTLSASKWAKAADKNRNVATKVNCKYGDNFACRVTVELPKTFNGNTDRNHGSSFLIVTLPYGAPETDIAVNLYDASGNIINFNGVQARIDSTGRANDLYRRVETRLELVDTYFPYPEYEIQMDGNANIQKSFYVTRDCWSGNNGGLSSCSDYGTVSAGI